MRVLLGLIAFIAFTCFSLAQLYAGFVGINHYFGSFGAFLALIFAFMFRFTLPITIGAFFGATEVWGWNPLLAILFVIPGLVFVIPGMLLLVISTIKGLLPKKRDPKKVIIEGKAHHE